MFELIRRITHLLHRRRFDEELRREMEGHREMAAAHGQTFGNTLRLRDEARDAWGWTWLDDAMTDVRFAVRLLYKSAGFTTAAVLTLALGIGVNVAVFGFFDLFALRPLPVTDPASIVRFHRQAPNSYATNVPYPAMAFYQANSKSLVSVFGLTGARLTIDDEDQRIRAHFVTPNYLVDLGAPLVLGRALSPEADGHQDAEPAVVLSEVAWRTRFAADPGILGRTIRLNQKPVTVVGVASETFAGLTSGIADVWVPIGLHPYFVAGSTLLTEYSLVRGVTMWGRLRPGTAAAAAEHELQLLAAALRQQYPPGVWEGERLESVPGAFPITAQGRVSAGSGRAPDVRNEVYRIMAVSGALVMLILAVACANLGALLLARGVTRERELDIRRSIGAANSRLVRQLLTESVVLAAVGSAVGFVLGSVTLRVMMVMTDAPAWLDTSPDWRNAVFAATMGIVSALMFGLAPAFKVAEQRHRATITRQVMIGAQVAASCTLLIVAGLLVRALDRAFHADPGFDFERVIAVDPNLSSHAYTPEAARAYFDQLQQQTRDLPGVASVSLTSTPPLGARRAVWSSESDPRLKDIDLNRVTPEYFRTMGIELRQGRVFAPEEPNAIVISESLARRVWNGGGGLGQQIELQGAKRIVVGIVGNARTMALKDPDAVECYLPAIAGDLASMVMLVKTSGPAATLAGTVSSVARRVDTRVNPEIRLLQAAFERSLEPVRNSALAVSAMGILALVLACLGVVGVVAYGVSQRTREIGIRVALGALPADVIAVLLRQFSRPIVLGLLAGIAGAAGLSQLVRRELYGVSHLDPLTYSAAVVVFVAAASVAAISPMRRALRISPLQALKSE